MRKLIIAVALALAPVSAKAERSGAERGEPDSVYWTLYRVKNADPDGRFATTTMLSGIVFALGYANASLIGDNRAPLYCQPEKLFLSVGQHIDMLQRWVRDQKAQMPSAYIDKMNVAMAMLYALKDTFPCDQKGRP